MDITRVIYMIYFFATTSPNRSEEILCKARPGCQLAKCDPGLPSSLLNTNEYPITCVKTAVQDTELKAENDELKKKLEDLLTAAYERIAILEELVTWYQASNGNFYKVFRQANYTDGLKNCMKYGARLAVDGIIDATVRRDLQGERLEQLITHSLFNFVLIVNGIITNLAHASFHRELLDKLIIPSGESTFIGLDDRSQEGTFVWLDGREYNAGDVNFGPGEPYDLSGNQDCVVSANFYNWKFDDVGCQGRMNYICEKLA